MKQKTVSRWLLTAIGAVFFAQAALGQVETTQGYDLGPEDVIAVVVVNHPEFSGEFTVPQSGVVQVPAVGDVSVTGKTLEELTTLVKNALGKRLREPEVSIALRKARVQRVYAVGDIRTPNAFDWKPGWTVKELLSSAGGLLPGLELADVTVRVERATKTKASFVLPLNTILESPKDGELDTRVYPSDVVTFTRVSTFPVYVGGKVKQPGQVILRSDSARLIEAITGAQGFVEGAAISEVNVVHADGTNEKFNLSGLFNQDSLAAASDSITKSPMLVRGDIVIVPETQDKFAVLGYVGKSGYFPLKPDKPITITEAIAQAEGSNIKGRLSRVGLVRMKDGKQTTTIYNVGKFIAGKDPTQNPRVMPGDIIYVPESDRVEVASVLSGISAFGILLNAVKR